MTVGEFEAHITVRCDGGTASATRLARWSAARGWKFTHIVLARGRTPSQPMVTLRGAGSYEEQLRACRWASDALRAAGFVPVRVKIEVAPWEPVVPRSDTEAVYGSRLGAAPGGRYFEHHLKVLLDPADVGVTAALTAAAVAHGAHLSWNARRLLAAGRQERFVTQRCHGVGLPAAERQLAALTRALEPLPVDILDVEREFVVYDSDVAVDAGWITAADSPAGREVAEC
ncbi:hypothetical protein [Actinacidiphila alni]|uniref:hypothetical protein n=1 Tax=Actinacidiphila alni TaxID=380248 RepID=UPI003451595E